MAELKKVSDGARDILPALDLWQPYLLLSGAHADLWLPLVDDAHRRGAL